MRTSTIRQAAAAAVIATVALASAGCGSADRPAGSAATTPVPGVPPGAVTGTVGGNGDTVHVAVGGTLSLIGFPSDWLPTTSDASVLANPPLPIDPVSCQKPPGVPCPLPPLNYKAVAKGTVKLTAHRTQCGEARPCVPPESYDYALTVVVD
jgi:hypothetical protein